MRSRPALKRRSCRRNASGPFSGKRVTRPPARRLAIEPLESRLLLAVVQWDGGPTGTGTSWSDPVNWVGDVLPSATDDVVIEAGYPGVVASGNVAIKSVTSDSPVEVAGGSFSVAELSTLTS